MGLATLNNIVEKRDSLTDGLVGYWPLNEGKDNIVYDYSGNKNNGRFVNNPVWNNFFGKTCLNLIGNNYIIFKPGIFSDYTYHTIGLLCNPNLLSASASYGFLVCDDVAPPYGGYSIYLRRTDFAIGKYMANEGGFIFQNTYKAISNKWNHIAIRIFANINGFIEINLNGIGWINLFSGDTSSVSGLSNNITNIGRWQGNSHFASGSIRDICVYNRLLSNFEIKKLYNLGLSNIQNTRSII